MFILQKIYNIKALYPSLFFIFTLAFAFINIFVISSLSFLTLIIKAVLPSLSYIFKLAPNFINNLIINIF